MFNTIIEIEFLIELTAIITAVFTFARYLKNIQAKINTPVLKEIKDVKNNQSKSYLELLKLTITNTEINPQERIRAYDKYIKAGGNGTIKTYVDKRLLPKLKKEYRGKIK
jgi:hypothetical protein